MHCVVATKHKFDLLSRARTAPPASTPAAADTAWLLCCKHLYDIREEGGREGGNEAHLCSTWMQARALALLLQPQQLLLLHPLRVHSIKIHSTVMSARHAAEGVVQQEGLSSWCRYACSYLLSATARASSSPNVAQRCSPAAHDAGGCRSGEWERWGSPAARWSTLRTHNMQAGVDQEL